MDDVERANIQALREEGDQVTNESLEATRRMRRLAEESQDVGAATLNELNEQGEQLDRVEGHLDNINSNLQRAEAEIDEMEKCCGCCVCPWNKTVNLQDRTELYEGADKKGRENSDNGKKGGGTLNKQPEAMQSPDGKYITSVDPADAREDEMNENIGAVGNIVSNLKNMALDMNTELDSQNTQLDRLNKKADLNESRLDQDNQRVSKLLKNA